MTILVLADHRHGMLAPATANTVTAASRLGGDIHILVAGHETGIVAASHIIGGVAATAAALVGVSQVVTADSPDYAHALAEPLAALVAALAPAYSHILAPATSLGRDILPRAAALLDVAPLSDVIEIVSGDTFVRPIYAGNALARVRSLDPVKLLTIRATAFPAAESRPEPAPIVPISTAIPTPSGTARFDSERLAQSDRPDLTTARVVVAGGRGLGSPENFRLVEDLADTLGAAVGASRAAVDAGFAANDVQVGQTGKIVAPELYIAVGISGAIQHVAGMKDAKIIVAINKDGEAPIFAVADYGLEEDLFTAVPSLREALSS